MVSRFVSPLSCAWFACEGETLRSRVKKLSPARSASRSPSQLPHSDPPSFGLSDGPLSWRHSWRLSHPQLCTVPYELELPHCRPSDPCSCSSRPVRDFLSSCYVAHLLSCSISCIAALNVSVRPFEVALTRTPRSARNRTSCGICRRSGISSRRSCGIANHRLDKAGHDMLEQIGNPKLLGPASCESRPACARRRHSIVGFPGAPGSSPQTTLPSCPRQP